MPPPGTNLIERFILYSNLYSFCIIFGAQLLQLPGGSMPPPYGGALKINDNLM